MPALPFLRLMALILSSLTAATAAAEPLAAPLTLHEQGYFATRGVNLLVYQNRYDGNFSDSKIAGIELIHHDVRTATNGDVRLSPTPEQWDPVPTLRQRTVAPDGARIEAHLEYPEEHFTYTFGVPITRGGWAGNGRVISFATMNYWLHRAFPDLIGTEHTFRGLDYLFGCHPGSNHSFVSGVGARSRTVAYGSNRADFSFIASGVVPGVLIIEPDFPENKEDWPFLWGQNEYVISLGANYLFLVHAAEQLLASTPSGGS
jgi:hypothetical protein